MILISLALFSACQVEALTCFPDPNCLSPPINCGGDLIVDFFSSTWDGVSVSTGSFDLGNGCNRIVFGQTGTCPSSGPASGFFEVLEGCPSDIMGGIFGLHPSSTAGCFSDMSSTSLDCGIFSGVPCADSVCHIIDSNNDNIVDPLITSSQGDPHITDFCGNQYEVESPGLYTYWNTTNPSVIVQAEVKDVLDFGLFNVKFSFNVSGVLGVITLGSDPKDIQEANNILRHANLLIKSMRDSFFKESSVNLKLEDIGLDYLELFSLKRKKGFGLFNKCL